MSTVVRLIDVEYKINPPESELPRTTAIHVLQLDDGAILYGSVDSVVDTSFTDVVQVILDNNDWTLG